MPFDDLELIKKIRSGQSDAFADLLRKYHANIRGLCVSILGNTASADDAAQDIFMKAYRSLDKFRGDSSFPTWLHRIASNHCLDILRQKKRHKEQSLEALVDREGGNIQKLFLTAPDSTLSLEDKDLLERVLGCLSPDYRLILTLREVQGLSYEDLAQVLECTLDAVKARLKRARQSLEEAMRHISEPNNV